MIKIIVKKIGIFYKISKEIAREIVFLNPSTSPLPTGRQAL
jgi:hypothetical protein